MKDRRQPLPHRHEMVARRRMGPGGARHHQPAAAALMDPRAALGTSQGKFNFF